MFQNKDIIFLDPVCTHNIWGGTRLREDFGYDVEGNDVGECWGISAHPNGDGRVSAFSKAERKAGLESAESKESSVTLSALWSSQPELFGNPTEDRFPLLTKIIDAKDDLSIQVHPDDEYAKENENGSLGKTECWYILDCDQDSTLVIGHHAKDKSDLEAMIQEGRWNDFIRQVPVKKGDFIQINPGTVHAIKGGILLLETQQNSDITYRVYDYDRLQNGKPRDLHVKQSIDVITVPAKSAEDSVFDAAGLPVNQVNELYACDYYKIYQLEVKAGYTLDLKAISDKYVLASITDGSGELDGHKVEKGDHFIFPAGYEKAEIKGDMKLILSTK